MKRHSLRFAVWLALAAALPAQAQSARFGGTHSAASAPVAAPVFRGGSIGPNLATPSILNPSVLNPGGAPGGVVGGGYGTGGYSRPGRYPRGGGGGVYIVPGYDYTYGAATSLETAPPAAPPVWAQLPAPPAPAPAASADPATIAAAVAAAVASQRQADARAAGQAAAPPTRVASSAPAKATTLYRCPGAPGKSPQFRDTPCRGAKATENVYTPGQ